MKPAALRIILIGALAVALVVALFAGSGYLNKLSPADSLEEGKLSPHLLEFETKFHQAMDVWNQNEKAFLAGDKASLRVLTKLNDDLKSLIKQSASLEGKSEIEGAIPHLAASAQAIGPVPEVLMMRQVNPALVSEAQIAALRSKLDKANQEWIAWRDATKTLSR